MSRSRAPLAVLAALSTLLALACSGDTTPNAPNVGADTTSAPSAPVTLQLQEVASGLTNPLYLVSPPGDTTRAFIVEQVGRIRILQNGQLLATPFLDIRSRVSYGGERGLLSMAFDPQYPARPYFYVDFTDTNGDTHVERFRVSSDPNVADASSSLLVLFVKQPFANHNGGLVMFGPDGMLYIGMGDGGGAGDTQGNGQSLGTLLGKMLRIDVSNASASTPYAVPRDNPFVGRAGAMGEIWAYGLRNPWRYAFDRTAGLLYIADVGQDKIEEVDVASASSGGLNYGWNRMEGSSCYNASTCDRAGLTLPAIDYPHSQGCSITGGFVYRGRKIPEIAGRYFYSDYCNGWLKSFRYANGAATETKDWSITNVGQILSFGQDGSGELYMLSETGRVYRIVRGS